MRRAAFVGLHRNDECDTVSVALQLFSATAVAVGLDVIPRQDNSAIWQRTWDALSYQPVNYSASMIDYQQAYFRGAGWLVNDASLIVQNGGRPIGLWPLFLGGPPNERCLTSLGGAIMAPIFATGVSNNTIKKAISSAIAFARELSVQIGSSKLDFAQESEPPLCGRGLTDWHKQLVAEGAVLSVTYDLYADLAPEVSAIRASFRKSYKPLVNAGLRNWNVFELTEENVNEHVWDEFKELHKSVVGRQTRPDETWLQQFTMIRQGCGFFVGLRDRNTDRLVGGGFFQRTRDEGMYAVAAYDRTLFDKPLGHAVQQQAIEHMKRVGLRWYRIGQRLLPHEKPRPTDKELKISDFKQGFASHWFCRYRFEL